MEHQMVRRFLMYYLTGNQPERASIHVLRKCYRYLTLTANPFLHRAMFIYPFFGVPDTTPEFIICVPHLRVEFPI